MSDSTTQKTQLSRREFLKIGGAVGAAVQVAAVGAAGVAAGKSYDSYVGWEDYEGETQSFDRKPFEFEGPAYKPVGPVSRPSKLTDLIFVRHGVFAGAMAAGWKPGDPLDAFPPPLAEFYTQNPEALELDTKRMTEILPKAAQDHAAYDEYFALANAFATGWENLFNYYPMEPTEPPEISDYKNTYFDLAGPIEKQIRETPLPFKSPEHASRLIKKVAHMYGATIVGIAKLNPDYLYDIDVRGGKPGPFEKPAHWEYAIVMGVPHEWDQVLSNPAHGTSYDGYNRARNAAGRLTSFLKDLGYPARAHVPPVSYDLVAPPIAVDAGIGQLGRHGFVITPETGSNLRLSVVTTNAPMAVDKPIDFGVTEFCNTCKICAENCPSGAISMADSTDGMMLRGYQHWYVNTAKCFNFWLQAMGPLGCRLCLAVCPYSRKNNWVHNLARNMDIYDPTSASKSALIWMQKNFFESPTAEEYLPPPDGRFAGYRPAPEWLEVENWFAVKPRNPQKGE